ncbi:MAG: hypothetical protein ACXWVK_08350 [Rhodoplanes sp.]
MMLIRLLRIAGKTEGFALFHSGGTNSMKLLPAKRRVGVGYEPAVPLILSAWWETSDRDKRQRLEVHIRWAHQYGVLETIDAFLRSLPESDWHHAD